MFTSIHICVRGIPVFWWPLALWYLLKFRLILLVSYWRMRWYGANDLEARTVLAEAIKDALAETGIK